MNSNQNNQNTQAAPVPRGRVRFSPVDFHAHVYVYQVGETLIWEKPNANGVGFSAYTAVVKAVGARTPLGCTYTIHVAKLGANHLVSGVLHGQLIRPQYHH